jgi:hypothetical protein
MIYFAGNIHCLTSLAGDKAKEVPMDENRKDQRQPNEGEGNRTAAREYNEAQQRFVESGKVEKKAREAERALDGPERQELEHAELIGKRHAAKEDPEVKRKY